MEQSCDPCVDIKKTNAFDQDNKFLVTPQNLAVGVFNM